MDKIKKFLLSGSVLITIAIIIFSGLLFLTKNCTENAFQKDVDKLRAKNSILQTEIDKSKGIIEKTNTQIKEAEIIITKLNTTQTVIENKKNFLESELNKSKKEIDKLKSEVRIPIEKDESKFKSLLECKNNYKGLFSEFLKEQNLRFSNELSLEICNRLNIENNNLITNYKSKEVEYLDIIDKEKSNVIEYEKMISKFEEKERNFNNTIDKMNKRVKFFSRYAIPGAVILTTALYFGVKALFKKK